MPDANKQSTVNKSDSDDENNNDLQLLTNDRGTYIPPSNQGRTNRFTSGGGKKKGKRSSSFEGATRPTLIQELLQGAKIQEEAQEESD